MVLLLLLLVTYYLCNSYIMILLCRLELESEYLSACTGIPYRKEFAFDFLLEEANWPLGIPITYLGFIHNF